MDKETEEFVEEMAYAEQMRFEEAMEEENMEEHPYFNRREHEHHL
jgi:hypothetical protein